MLPCFYFGKKHSGSCITGHIFILIILSAFINPYIILPEKTNKNISLVILPCDRLRKEKSPGFIIGLLN